jgi:quercetin dioxygenase-like cupin family protein
MKHDHYESGSLYGIRYHFQPGERLWPHVHVGETADQHHNIIVLKGTIEFKGDELRLLKAGDVFDFDGAQPHAIVALEESVTLHLMIHGKPVSFANYTEEQKHGES